MRESGFLSEALQHPRRSLGNRYRSQAEKVLSLIGSLMTEFVTMTEDLVFQVVLLIQL